MEGDVTIDTMGPPVAVLSTAAPPGTLAPNGMLPGGMPPGAPAWPMQGIIAAQPAPARRNL